MCPRPVLVVDDDADIRTHVARVLEIEGYETLQAANGQAALDLLLGTPDARRPGCVLLDITMPIMDGLTLIGLMRGEHRDTLGGVGIVVATARGSPLHPFQLPIAVDQVVKPFEIDELLRAIAKHCGPATCAGDAR